jgi:hypothetical protein
MASLLIGGAGQSPFHLGMTRKRNDESPRLRRAASHKSSVAQAFILVLDCYRFTERNYFHRSIFGRSFIVEIAV